MAISAKYDREADALYVRLGAGERQRTVEVDDSTYVDVDPDGRAIGLEFLYPSMGLELDGVVARFSLEEQLPLIISAIATSNAPIVPPTMTSGQHLASTAVVVLAIEGTVAAGQVVNETVSVADRPGRDLALPA